MSILGCQPRPLRLGVVASLLALALLSAAFEEAPAARAAGAVTVTDYTDPEEAIGWAQRSYWEQPWRSYSDTVPATTLLDAVGINFNVTGAQAAATARLLGDSGFSRARIEVGWSNLSYDDPNQLLPSSRATLTTKLTALRENGLRPLIVLNANHGLPCPTKAVSLSLAQPAAAGATVVQLDPASIEPGEIVPGRTGINANGVAANNLILSVDASGIARLSKPLKAGLAAGPVAAVTLRYEPFSPDQLPDGSPNPRAAETMEGWLSYVRVTLREVKAILGSDEFDVEVWNELSFGSNFLNINNYYEPDLEAGAPAHSSILERTAKLIHDPASGFPDVEVGNGFANQSPHGRGIYDTAIDKHPYHGLAVYPRDKDLYLVRPTNGLGEPDGVQDSAGIWHDSFTPSFKAYFPEYFLAALQPETLIRDLAPYVSSPTNKAEAERHGRAVTAEGSTRPSPVWITEVNLPPDQGTTPASQLSEADEAHIEAKSVLRYIASYVNKGVKALDFYAASDGHFSLVDKGFFEALKSGRGAYPGDLAGGETIAAVRRLTAAFAGAEPISRPREIRLQALTDYSGNVQFEGDGTAAHPPLYNRDVFAFFPFQVSDHRFVVPTYVMTRDVTHDYDPGAGAGPARFDLPPETFGLRIGGVEGLEAEVTALDPLTGEETPVEVTGRSEDWIAVNLAVTDSPRLLVIQEKSSAPETGIPPEPEAPVEPEEPVETGAPEEPEEPAEPDPPAELEEPRQPEAPAEPEEPGQPEAPVEPEAPGQPEPPAEPDQPEEPSGPDVPTGPEEESPAASPPSAAGDSSAGAPAVTLHLAGRSSLLRQGRMTVIARCDRPCRVEISGIVQAGRRRAGLRSARGAGSRAGPSTPARIELTLSQGAASLLRSALARRAAVVATVVASAESETGLTDSSRRSLLLSPAQPARVRKRSRSDARRG